MERTGDGGQRTEDGDIPAGAREDFFPKTDKELEGFRNSRLVDAQGR
jgi:hypothetical protein